ncbi:helix-turn-helix domain-containing protein [Mesorhizobium sp. B1-1-9]|uniref:helix-turn-helix transcriptional regulator n=1 Tax=Mesorhizobium sp. B1-1-9 TaxID=2589975 RepID=UPI00112B1678|nr:helix-turn-helix domain-containing protein [Mesorhizobium sp. B1-1-9]TPN58641.1 helix-turn-helix domain-containing protein [Mesorhizobium sp. B1-1-9]
MNTSNTQEGRKMLRTDGAALHVGLSVSTLEKLRLTGDGPEYIKLGRAVVYKSSDLDAWMESNRRKSTSVAA